VPLLYRYSGMDRGKCSRDGRGFRACRHKVMEQQSASANKEEAMTSNMQSGQHSNEQIAAMKKPPVVSMEEWQKAWQEMLVKEKEHTRSRDALAAARRRMPWLAVENDYFFDGPQGKVSLLDLFEGRRQLVL
jgi:hypothetical protein